jgi:serine/threonine-protein kinase HipA
MTVRVLDVWSDGHIVWQFTQDRHGDIGFAL